MLGHRGLVIASCLLFSSCAGDDGGGDGSSCGDGVCGLGESQATCAVDCTGTNPRCGDGVCNGTETASSCAADCTSSACTTSPDNCTGETLCVGGSCVAAFPRVYAITGVSVSVPTTNPNNGQTWDVGGGAPDLFLGNSNGVAFSGVVADQFSATFAGPFDVQLVAGATLRIDVWDEDVTTHDAAFACQANPITAQLLRTRTFACAVNGMTMTSTIRPK
ncbi:MAG: hypothetical protein JNL83_21310 [Myxococcales bacterium]|nr:hypothetical protein [Myxococcales bacterium]